MDTRVAPPAGRGAARTRGHRRVVVLAVAGLLLVAARAWAVEPLRIPSTSMAPTLRAGDHVLAEKVTRHVTAWRPGDVVVFTSRAGDELMLKRLVGMPGDRVAIRDGRLFVNGVRIKESYVDHAAMDSVYYGPVLVPDGAVLVLGDNRAESEDSRSFGPVPMDRIEGRVVAVMWPPTRSGLLTSEEWQ